MVENLDAQSFMAMIPQMKGTGALSDAEGKKLAASLQNFSLKQSPEQLMSSVKEAQRLMLKARKNPDGKTLQDILPPATYQRWLVMKQKYIGKDKDIENWRPIFAAQELYEKAIRKAGLSNEGIVWPEAKDLAEDADVPVTRPEITVNIGDPKKFIKEFNRKALSDVACFEKTLDSIERDVQFMAERGRLWAVGDVAGLRRISQADFSGACIDALVGSGVGQSAGLGDIEQRALNAWLLAVEQALIQHRSSVAIVNIAELIKPNGMLERLAAKGYTVTEPAAVP